MIGFRDMLRVLIRLKNEPPEIERSFCHKNCEIENSESLFSWYLVQRVSYSESKSIFYAAYPFLCQLKHSKTFLKLFHLEEFRELDYMGITQIF